MDPERQDYSDNDPPPWWMWYMPSGEAVLKVYVIVLIAGSLLTMAGVLLRWG